MNKEEVCNILNALNIEYDETRITSKGWMLCRCPLHFDEVMSNAGINIYTGVINCFSCKQSVSLKKLIEEKGLNIFQEFDFVPVEKIKEKRKIQNYDYNFVSFPLKPEKYNYTKIRGYTKDFCEKFNIVKCISGDYENYFITPIIDTFRDIKTYEARKLCKKEILQKYYKNVKTRIPLEELFEKECKEKRYRLDKDQIYDWNHVHYFSYDLLYLLKPKVLYPYMSGTWATIFNADNLKINEDLWLSEGTGSFPKIYQGISENATSVFGSKISEEQFKILKDFKKDIIVIPDLDLAGYMMILSMYKELNKFYVCPVEVEDTDNNYIDKIKETPLMSPNEFLIKYSFD